MVDVIGFVRKLFGFRANYRAMREATVAADEARIRLDTASGKRDGRTAEAVLEGRVRDSRRNFLWLAGGIAAVGAAWGIGYTLWGYLNRRVEEQPLVLEDGADPQLKAYLKVVQKSMQEIVQKIYAFPTDDPEEISHRILVDARPAQRQKDIETLIGYLQAPIQTIPHPHFPRLQDPHLRVVLPRSQIEGHHAQAALRLALVVGFDHQFQLSGRTYTIQDIIDGEFIKGGDYQGIRPEAEGYFENFLVPLLNQILQSRGETIDDFSRNPQPVLEKAASAMDTQFNYLDISWFTELAARRYVHNDINFETPLKLGPSGRHPVSMDDLVMSQIALFNTRERLGKNGQEKKASILVPLVEMGVHMLDMISTVTHLFEKDPTAQKFLPTYQDAVTRMYTYFFTAFQQMDISEAAQLGKPNYKQGIDAHMLQYIFDPESWKPAGYELDKLDVVNPKTQADKNVASLIERMHTYGRALKPGEDFGPSTHLYAGLRHLEKYLVGRARQTGK